MAIRRGTLTSYDDANVCAFTKTSGAESVFVVCNLRNSSVNFTLPAAVAGTFWTDVLKGEAVSLNTQLTLAPNNYLVLKN